MFFLWNLRVWCNLCHIEKFQKKCTYGVCLNRDILLWMACRRLLHNKARRGAINPHSRLFSALKARSAAICHATRWKEPLADWLHYCTGDVQVLRNKRLSALHTCALKMDAFIARENIRSRINVNKAAWLRFRACAVAARFRSRCAETIFGLITLFGMFWCRLRILRMRTRLLRTKHVPCIK